jgi:oligoendopeptidase F
VSLRVLWLCFGAALSLPLTRGYAATAPAFVASSSADASRYHIDLARHYYSSPELEQTARSTYETKLTALEAYGGRSTSSAASLLAALQARDQAEVEFMRHYTYLYLRHAVDTTDGRSDEQATELDAQFTARTEFLSRELADLDPATFDDFVATEPRLKAYAPAIEMARRWKPHLLPIETAQMLDTLSPVTQSWQSDLYDTLIARTPFGTVAGRDGELDVRRQRPAIATDPDRAVRRAGFERYYAGFASQRELYAFALVDLVKARDALARAHGFADGPEQVYFASSWTTGQVRTLLERIGNLAGVYRRYQQMRVDYLHARSGLDVAPWDLQSAPADAPVPRFTIAEGSAQIRVALAPLGPEYGRELAALLNPANGRMDIVPGPNRKSGGFSRGFPGVTTAFYSAGYEGYYNDLRVIAHESTHAIHRQLMKDHDVLPIYADGPGFLFESFAILNELLLPEYLHAHAREPDARRYFLEQFFDGKGMALFFVAQDAALEQAIHEGVTRGDVRTADDLDELTATVNSRYSIWDAKYPQLNERWMTNGLFYEDPLYNINYVYGAMLALEYYTMLHADRRGFARRYVALLSNGFDGTPAELLRRFLGIDLDDPGLLDDAVAVLTGKLDDLQQVYAQTTGTH